MEELPDRPRDYPFSVQAALQFLSRLAVFLEVEVCCPAIDLRHELLAGPSRVLIALHRERFPAPGLPVDEDRRVEADEDLIDEEVGSRPPKDALLRRLLAEDLVEPVSLHVPQLV